MKQFLNHTTFFDLGIDEEINNFSTLYCVMTGVVKKRNNITRLALRYLLNDNTLTADEIVIAKSIIDDSYYNKPKKYKHCKICSNEFQREILKEYSSRLKYWEVCFPTVPYFPGNMMIYLKDRVNKRIENFQDLNIFELEELQFIMQDLIEILNCKLFNGTLSGINILFNQISKSQLCIHGHVELMICDIDKLNYGCELLNIRNYDPVVNYANSVFSENSLIIKTLEGIRIDINSVGWLNSLNYLRIYEDKLKEIINIGHFLRSKTKTVNNNLEHLLLYGMSPAPTNSVYITNYRNNLFLSSIPEIIPHVINLESVGDLDDAENMYLIKYNATTPDKKYSIIKHYSPLVRPSSKVPCEFDYTKNVKKLIKCIGKVLT